jgi:hypothetical protein
MKATIDFPEELLRRAKIIAVQRRTTLKELVVQGLECATRNELSDAETERKQRNRSLLDALSEIRITAPVGRFKREQIHDRHEGCWE